MNRSEQMEEALRKIDGIVTAKEYLTTVERKIHRIAKEALALPRRQCDVGTAEEQSKRFHDYCLNHSSACDVDMECCRCPLEKVKARCQFAWAQMPYAQEGGAEWA